MATLSLPGVRPGARPVAAGPCYGCRPLTAPWSGRLVKFRLAPGLSLIVACCLALTACSSMQMPMSGRFYKKPSRLPKRSTSSTWSMPTARPRISRSTGSAIRWSSTCRASAAPAMSRRACRKKPPGRCGSAVRVRPGSVGADRDPGRGAQCPAGRRTKARSPSTSNSRPASTRRRPRLSTFPGGRCRQFVEEPAVPASEAPAFVSPTEVPKPSTEVPRRQRQRHHHTRRSAPLSLRRHPAPDVTLQGS